MAQSIALSLKLGNDDIKGESSIHTLERENTIECLGAQLVVVVGSRLFKRLGVGFHLRLAQLPEGLGEP